MRRILSQDEYRPQVHRRRAGGARYFTDLLTLIHLDGRWQIIAKVFHYEEQAQPG
jgi:hypothetical protein